jgi:hypothetical protein
VRALLANPVGRGEIVQGQRTKPQQWPRPIPILGPRRAALAGLVLGAALWNLASLRQVADHILSATPAAPGDQAPRSGCTSLSLDRPSGRTVAWPCPEPAAWMESAVPAAARLASAVGR